MIYMDSENRSVKDRIWELRGGIPDKCGENEIAVIEKELGVSHIMARLLWGRNYKTPNEARCFLSMGDTMIHDPYLLDGMKEAVERIERALDDPTEHIAIYGDYDVDGVTAVSALCLYLRERAPGLNIEYYIPSRSEDGYGVNCRALDLLASHGVTLMITVDTGITAVDEAEYAEALGIDVIITDHHECRPRLPRAIAVIDPHREDSQYPFCELAGVGVVFKLICAMEIAACRRDGAPDSEGVRRAFGGYADLAAIGTIADVMPLTDENRMIVAYGLSLIEKTERPGLSALLEAAQNSRGESQTQVKKRKINAGYISFGIAPKINAAGRMEDASIAAELFLTSDEDRAEELAYRLCDINRRRQTEENKLAEEAFAAIEEQCDIQNDRVIVIENDSWMQGIIGIVASRVVEKYGRPAILITFDGCSREDEEENMPGDVGKGSGRSVKGINLCEALGACSDILTRYGGHELAAGLSIERGKINEFRRRINEYARERLAEDAVKITSLADGVAFGNELTMELAEELRALEPCGVANPTPSFILKNATVMRIASIGAGKHIKLTLEADGAVLSGVWFGMPMSSLTFHENEKIDVIFNLDINEYRGISTVQLLISDARVCADGYETGRSGRETFDRLLNGQPVENAAEYLPERADFITVYRLLCREVRVGRDTFGDSTLMWLLKNRYIPEDRGGREISYVKLRVILAVLEEMRLIAIEEPTPESVRVTILPTTEKVDLESSLLLCTLRQRYGEA